MWTAAVVSHQLIRKKKRQLSIQICRYLMTTILLYYLLNVVEGQGTKINQNKLRIKNGTLRHTIVSRQTMDRHFFINHSFGQVYRLQHREVAKKPLFPCTVHFFAVRDQREFFFSIVHRRYSWWIE